jgi:PBSX family phage terminase large subunit
MIIHTQEGDKIYEPTKTGHTFHSDNSFVRLIMGPYGSGKSTLCMADIVRRTCEMPHWSSGRRRARWCIVRNTSGELQSTTLQTWLAWFGELGDVSKRQKPILTYEHMFNDGHGVIELEVMFLALDKEQDIRKIKSLELTGCYINEASEVPKAALAHMKGRVNRYPSKAFCDEPYWSGIIADTNPCSMEHWIYQDFMKNSYESHRLFKQPPGLIKNEEGKFVRNLAADNVNHLPDNYYIALAEGQSEEFRNVFCLGEWGVTSLGKLVYSEFNSDLHATEQIDAIQGEPLYCGVDFGLTPSVVVVQFTARGQMLILKEYVGEDIGIRNFMESVVLPEIARDFPYCKIADVICDPAGGNRSEVIEEMSAIGELQSMGLSARAATSNAIDARLSSVKFFLNKLIDGKPLFKVSRTKCPVIYEGFLRNYVYKRLAVSGEARYREVPDKNMSSHCLDALGYVCLEFATNSIIKEKMQNKPLENMFNPVFRGL